MRRIVKKENLLSSINDLLEDYEVIAPVEISNKGIFYQPITNIEDLYLGEGFTIEPIKKFFLSPSEWILSENLQEKEYFLEDSLLSEGKRIIIGARPCEARGLTLLDKIFNPSTSAAKGVDSGAGDKFYINNRNRTIIVGLACATPDKSCFCTSMHGSPVGTEGMDALLLSSGDSFIVEAITAKGKEIFDSLGEPLSEGQKKSLELDKEKRTNLISRKIKIPENLSLAFESPYWDKVSFPCISCGICTYLCPTCHCFDLIDEQRKCLRCYDGCSFPDFTLQASGENPRPSKRERYRQRVFHKFDYFKKNFGENLCVGCGRCIRHCPVKIDIAEIVAKTPIG